MHVIINSDSTFLYPLDIFRDLSGFFSQANRVTVDGKFKFKMETISKQCMQSQKSAVTRNVLPQPGSGRDSHTKFQPYQRDEPIAKLSVTRLCGSLSWKKLLLHR